MSQNQDIKIRVLPRASEKKGADKPVPPSAKPKRWIIYVTVALLVGLGLGTLAPRLLALRSSKTAAVSQTDLASKQDPYEQKINQHLRDSQIKREILQRSRQLGNAASSGREEEESQILYSEDSDRSLGVQLDQDDSMDRVYRDLTYRQNRPATEFLPDERINARLANRRWINEEERAERIQFIRNFIRAAYDRGYQVEIDRNLVVVGVKRITDRRQVNIEQVLDRLAAQGL